MSLPRDIVPDRDEAVRRQQADPLVASAVRAADLAGQTDCPDAEYLALYVERELGTAELGIVLPHLRTCERCQAIVTAYERASTGAPATAGSAAAGSAVAGAGSDGARGQAPWGWFTGWRWLVPAGSLAAAVMVAVWLGQAPSPDLRQTYTGPAPATPATPASAVSAPERPAAPPVAGAPAEAFRSGGGVPGGLPGGVAAAPSDVVRQGINSDQPRPSPSPDTAATAVALADAGARRTDAARSEETRTAAAPSAGAPSATPPAAASAAASPAGNAAPAAGGAAGRSALALESPADVAQRARTPGEPPGVRPAGEAAAAQVTPAVPAQAARAAKMAVATTWRVRDGRLERTTDAGRTWRRVTAPFRGAVASVEEGPDGSVLVTAATGARVVTSDGGRTWRHEP